MLVDGYAKRIKELRKEMQMTQEEFAKVLGVSFSTINRWENEAHEPTLRTKRKLKGLFREYGIGID